MITITGATGNLGRLIVAELLRVRDGSNIAAVARAPEKARDLAAQGVVVRQGDYDDYDSLVRAFADTDILMFISNADVRKRREQHENVVRAAQAAGVRRVVYTSFVAVETDEWLGRTHLETEQMIRGSGLPYTMLRNNFYMDMYVVEVELAMKSGAYRSPSGEAGAAFVSRADIARTAAVVLTTAGHEGQTYDLTGPATVTPQDFANIAAQLSGKPVVYQPITWEELAADYRDRGMPEPYVQLAVQLEQLIATNALAGVSNNIAYITGQPAQDFTSFARQRLG